MTGALPGFWHRLWARAPRRLRITRAGKILIAIALLAGLAALNTGNNPLFLAWGMVLGAMVVSGVLSEAALRPLEVSLKLPDEVRSQTPSHLRARLTNTSRFLPAMAIEVLVQCQDPQGDSITLFAPYELRLDAQKSRELYVPLLARRRGTHVLTGLSVRTAYPFGLFVKERPLKLAPLTFLALPAAGLPQSGAQTLTGRQGQHAAAQAGDGEDYFAQRLYRLGDPLKHVLWRRVGKIGRWLVVEREAQRAQRLTAVLQVASGAGDPAVEAAISAAGTWMEQMLAQGLAVGLLAPGVRLAAAADGPGHGRQRRALLRALAQLDARAPMPQDPGPGRRDGAQVYLTAPGLVPAEASQTSVALRLGAP